MFPGDQNPSSWVISGYNVGKREAEDTRSNDYFCFDRAKVKNGLKIISTQTTNPAWSLSFDVNGKHIAAAVTAVRNFSVSTQPHQPRYVVVVVGQAKDVH